MPALVSKMTGDQGEVRVGGRMAARFGKWTWEPTGDGEKWVIEAPISERDPHWLASPGPFEVRLHYLGRDPTQTDWLDEGVEVRRIPRQMRWKGVAVTVHADTINVRGEGNPEVL